MTKCISCGSHEYRFLFEVKGRLHGVEVSSVFTYVQRTQCNLVFMQPQISSETLQEFYATDYAPHQVIRSSEPKKFKGNLFTLIKNYLYDHRNITYIPSLIRKTLTTESKVLDVGCGNT